jgi:hypothetical protein
MMTEAGKSGSNRTEKIRHDLAREIETEDDLILSKLAGLHSYKNKSVED